MKIGPRFKLIESEDSSKIIQAYLKDDKYYIFEKSIEQGTKTIKLNDESQNSDDFNYIKEYLIDFKQQEPNTLYAFIDNDSIFTVGKEDLDQNDSISKITIHNIEDKKITKGNYVVYKGEIYKFVISHSKLAFLYHDNNHETAYGIMIFQAIDDMLSKKVLFDIKSPHLGKINDISFSSDCNYLYSCGSDGSVKIWCLQNPELRSQSIFLANGPIVTVKPNPFDDSLFVAACTNGYLIFYSMKKNQKKKVIHISCKSGTLDKSKDKNIHFTEPVTWADFSPIDPTLTFAAGLSEIKIYSIPDLFE